MANQKLLTFRSEYRELMKSYSNDAQFNALMNILRSSDTTISMNRVLMQRLIDSSWVEAIELGIMHLDNVLRIPRKTIEDIEEIVPIALSRKITVESVKHLGQHTDLIQSVDPITGKIIPSKILNVHKEESLMTYENKFINTLIERLLVFINVRYEKLAEISRDFESFTMDFSTSVEDEMIGKTKIEIKIENEHNLSSQAYSNGNTFERVKKLKKIIESYKESTLCKTLGNTYIRPPVMRTNAIMKNVDLKACLTLWQYIEGYDKIGYEMNIEDSAVVPDEDFVEDFYELIGLHIMLFRASASSTQELIEARQLDPILPKIIKQFDTQTDQFDYSVFGGYDPFSASEPAAVEHEEKPPSESVEDAEDIAHEIGLVIAIEKAFREQQRERELAEKKAAEERERLAREEEQRRIDAAKTEKERAELERQRQERIRRENMKQEEIERERQEEERKRLAQMEETQRREAAEKARADAAYKRRKKDEEREQKEREEAKIRALRHLDSINDRKRFNKKLEEDAKKISYEIAQSEEIYRRRIAFQNQGIYDQLAASVDLKEFNALAAALAQKNNPAAQETKADDNQVKELKLSDFTHRPPISAPKTDDAADTPKSEKHVEVTKYRKRKQEEAEEAKRRAKFLAERREKAHAEALRAKRLKNYRLYYENKDYYEIYREYSNNPIWVVLRFITHVLAVVFGIIPKYTDRPDYIKLRQKLRKEAEQKRIRAEQQEKMEELFVRYAQTKKYRRKRKKEENRQFNERIRELRANPALRYASPLTPEQRKKQKEDMAELFKKYRLPLFQRIRHDIEDERYRKDPYYTGGSLIDKAQIRRVTNGIIIGFMAVSIGLSIYVTACTATGKIVSVAGYSVLRVETGSMEPALHVGDFIIIKRCDPSDLAVDDIVSYFSEDPETEGMLITHRIEAINDDGTFVMRGDANPVSDHLSVQGENILGVFTRKSKFYLWLGSFANTNKLFLLFVLLPLTLVSIYELRSMILIAKEAVKEEKEEEENEKKIQEEYERRMRAAIDFEKGRLAAKNGRSKKNKSNNGKGGDKTNANSEVKKT